MQAVLHVKITPADPVSLPRLLIPSPNHDLNIPKPHYQPTVAKSPSRQLNVPDVSPKLDTGINLSVEVSFRLKTTLAIITFQDKLILAMESLEILERKIREFADKNALITEERSRLVEEVEILKKTVRTLEEEKQQLKTRVDNIISVIEQHLGQKPA